jgi:CheY-like chemotaxis protein
MLFSASSGDPLKRRRRDERNRMPQDKILLVEDDAVTAKLTRRALEALGTEVTICRDGKEALEVFASIEPDLVITDAMLPGMDGSTLTAKIPEQEKGSSVLIIMTTAVYRKDVYREAANRIGISHFMPKPLDPDEFSRKIAELLGLST